MRAAGLACFMVAVSLLGIGLAAPVGGQGVPPGNDGFADAWVLDLECGQDVCESGHGVSTVGATTEEGEPLDACWMGATVWYRFDVQQGRAVRLDFVSDFALAVAVFEGNGTLDGLSGQACGASGAPDGGDVGSNLTFQAWAGSWWIQVGGQSNGTDAEAGNFTLAATSEATDPRLRILPEGPTVRINEKSTLTAETRNFDPDSVAWDLGDGSAADGFEVRHRWNATGAYNVTATGTWEARLVLLVDAEQTWDGNGSEEVVSPWWQGNTTVTVVPAALTAAFSIEDDGGPLADPVRAPVGAPLEFAEEAFGGSGALTFTWSFGDGGGAEGVVAQHAYSDIGSYTARLTVRDATGATASVTRLVHVYLEAPLAGEGGPGDNVTLDVPGYLAVVCALSVGGEGNTTFGGTAVLATHPAGLGGSPASFTVARGVLFASITGGPEGGQCDRVTLTLTYKDAYLAAAGASESRLRAYYWNGASWLLMTAPAHLRGATPAEDLQVFSVAFAAAANQAVLATNHTSTFALGSVFGGGGGGAPAPIAEAPAATTTAEPAAADGEGAEAVADADGGDGAGADGAAGDGAAGPGTVGGPAGLDVRRPDGSLLPGLRVPGSTLGGPVVVHAVNAPGDGLVYLLVLPDGRTLELARGVGQTGWDTRQVDNGRYTIELQGEGGIVLASGTYLVYNGRAEAVQVAGALVVGAGIMAGGFLLSILFGIGQEGALAVGEDKFRERTKRQRITAWLARVPTLPSLLLAVPVFVAFFTLDGMEALDWAAYLDRLPYVASAGAVVFAAAYGLEILLNVASGARSRFQLLLTGALALAASTLLFRTAFGYPGFVEEDEVEGGLPPRVEGLRSIALLSAILSLAVPCYLVLAFGPFRLGETGLTIVMALLATSSLPFRPVPGANIWRWNRAVSVLALATAFGLFAAYELGAVPLQAFAALGLVGLASFAVLYRSLRTRPRPTAPSGSQATVSAAPSASAAPGASEPAPMAGPAAGP